MYRARRGPRGPQPVDADTIRHSGIAQGRAMHRAARGDRDAREALAALAQERAAEQVTQQAVEEPPKEEPRTPRPDPSQGARGGHVPGFSRMDEGRAMFRARGRTPTYDDAA